MKRLKIGLALVLALVLTVSGVSGMNVPDEIFGKPYYFNDYARISDATSPSEFGHVTGEGFFLMDMYLEIVPEAVAVKIG